MSSDPLARGLGYHQAGKLEQADAQYRRVLEREPGHAVCLHLRGVLAVQRGKPALAVTLLERAATLRPDHAEGLGNLGAALVQAGRLAEAETACLRALTLNPALAEVRLTLGNALIEQHRPDEAEHQYRLALAAAPDSPDVLANLAMALIRQGDGEAAVACCRQALTNQPDHVEALNNLGSAWLELGQLVEAEACFRNALFHDPGYADAHYNLGNALVEQGRLAEAEARFRQALTLRPGHRAAHGNLVYLQMFLPDQTLAGILAEHRRWNELHAARLRSEAPRHRPAAASSPEPFPRLGFVSAGLRGHPVGHFTIRVLEALHRRGRAVICYAGHREAEDDTLSARFRASATAWHRAHAWSDSQLADTIRADGIELLFDLDGHMERNRLLTFARKPAPVQVTWAGYMATTGLSAIDYLLADRHQVPPEDDRYYVERVVRLPDGFICYEPPADTPPVTPLPALSRGDITLGSFNILAKITDAVIARWSRLLHRLPGARLVMKTRALSCPATCRALALRFADHGIAGDRLVLLGRTSRAEHMAVMATVDIALDPLPFSGSTTTLECLWMGVPVVTCPGRTFAGRHSLSALATLGLTETIAPEPEAIIDIITAFAGNLDRLSQLRASLRERMAGSPLMDAERFTDHFEAACLTMWQRYCAGQPPQSFAVPAAPRTP